MTEVRRPRRFAVVLPALLSTLVGCHAGGTVVRLVDGQEVRGRAVREEAYALYVRAAVLEASGETERAVATYLRVLDYDPMSVESWTRIGALLCVSDSTGAHRAFVAGESIDANYEPLWRERARCNLRSGEFSEALRRALRAARLDPDRVETSLLVAEAYERAGKVDDARRWLTALVLRSEASAQAWNWALAFAERHEDQALLQRARAHLELLRPAADDRIDPETGRAAIDRALLAYELDSARSLAVRSGIPAAEVALRAAALGRSKLAREQALLVLDADPRSSDAWVAALVAGDLDRDVGLIETAAASLADDPAPLSPLGVLLLREVLERVAGADAAQAWSMAYGPVPASTEPLARRVSERQ